MKQDIDEIFEIIMDYVIRDELKSWLDISCKSFTLFIICCELNFEKAVDKYKTCTGKNRSVEYIFDIIIEKYELKRKLEKLNRYKEKYKLLKEHLKYMPDGEGYLESKKHFEQSISRNEQ